MKAKAPRRALVSCSDTSGLDSFVAGLVELEFEIVSTGGTRKFLEDRSIPVVDVSSYTGFPEMMDGRVKTLHPKVHGAILGRPDLPEDQKSMREHGIVPFELVVVNLYPFEQTIARAGVTVAEAIEQIDIGGPSMLRSAAKNHAYVGIVTRSEQYARVLAALSRGPLDESLRRLDRTALGADADTGRQGTRQQQCRPEPRCPQVDAAHRPSLFGEYRGCDAHPTPDGGRWDR